jgi:hypothetical protein
MNTVLTYPMLAELCDRKLGMRDVPCPFCGPDRRALENRKRRVLRVWHREPGFASFHCARCGERGWTRSEGDGEHRRAVQPQLHPDDDQDRHRRVDLAIQIWAAAVPLSRTLGWKYFTERRGLHIGALDDLSHALHWNERIGAVIALMTDPVTNEPTCIHRTFLNTDGTKRERKMLGKQGVIRLSREEAVTEGLGLTEGIEDGLSVLLSGWAPVWAATSAGGIERFPVLSGVECLTIFSDTDPTGMRVAHACAARWTDAGREARLSPSGALSHAA